jgi:hypothetical protein
MFCILTTMLLIELPPYTLRIAEMKVLHINQMAIFRTKQKDASRNLGRKSSLGARLRTRKVTGRDASLPAPLLSVFKMLVARGTVGALPQTPQGTLSLDPARGNCPLTPFRD